MNDALLIERAEETARIASLLKAALDGVGTAAVVLGEPGMGKSRLLQWAHEEAKNLGLSVLRARCSQLEEDFAFGTALQLFEPLLRGRSQPEIFDGAARLALPLFQGHSGSASDGSGSGYRYGLYWLLCNLAIPAGESDALRPVMLVIDDLQWSDAASVRWLTYLLDRLEGLPVVLLAAARPPRSLDTESAVGGLLAHPGVRVQRLRPLSAEGSAQLVRTQFPEAVDAFCHECHRVTGGNPFLLQALILDEERGDHSGGEDALTRLSQAVPAAVLRSVLARLASTPAAATRLCLAVAVLGDDAPLERCARLADLPPAEAGQLVDQLAALGILRRGEPLGFLHSLLRSALYDDVPVHTRSALHIQAARLSADDGDPVERAAAHLLQSSGSLDPWAISLLRAASNESLGKGDSASALHFLTRALAGGAPTQRGELLMDLARAQAHGDAAAAIASVRAALPLLDDPVRSAEANGLLGRMLSMRGRPKDAAEVFRAGLNALREASGCERLRQELEVGFAAAATLDPELRAEGIRMMEDALACLEGMPAPAAPLLAQLALRRCVAGEPAENVRALAQTALFGDQLIESLRSGDVGFSLAVSALIFVDELDLAEAALDAGIEHCRKAGSLLGFAEASHWRAWVKFYRGSLLDAAADAEQAIAAHELGWGSYLGAAGMVLGLSRWEHGDAREAALALERCNAVPGTGPDRALLQFLQARMARAKGQTAEAVEVLRAIGHQFSGTFAVRNPGILPWRSELALCLSVLGEDVEASQLASEEVRLARAVNAARPLGVALRIAGLIEGRDRGLELLGESVQVLEGSPSRLEYCRSLIALGAALRRSGQRIRARERLEEGLELARQFGAALLADQAAEELRTMGLRLRSSAHTGIDALTPSEHRACLLAARGLSNRAIAQALFVTVKTVEMHLGRAYRKLEVNGRADLGTLLPRQE